MEIIDLELKTLQSGHDFQSQGRMSLNIGQGQRSLYAKYGKNPSRTVDFFQGEGQFFFKLSKIQISRFWKKRNMRHTL